MLLFYDIALKSIQHLEFNRHTFKYIDVFQMFGSMLDACNLIR